jgi:hypothetical protein
MRRKLKIGESRYAQQERYSSLFIYALYHEDVSTTMFVNLLRVCVLEMKPTPGVNLPKEPVITERVLW